MSTSLQRREQNGQLSREDGWLHSGHGRAGRSLKRDLGVTLLYPTYREGYGALLRGLAL